MKYKKDKAIYNIIINIMCTIPSNSDLCLKLAQNIKQEILRKEIEYFINKVRKES